MPSTPSTTTSSSTGCTIGVRDDVLSWITSFITGRTRRVRVGGQYSTYSAAHYEVQQGSVLGPILFLLYAADVLYRCTSRYADDTQLYQLQSSVASRPGIWDHSTALLMCLVGVFCAPLAQTVSLYDPSDFLRSAAELFRLLPPRSGTRCRTVLSQ